MRRRRSVRGRLLWAGVLFGLVLLLVAVSALRIAVWTRDEAARLVPLGRGSAFAR
jgi:hypothetical protein